MSGPGRYGPVSHIVSWSEAHGRPRPRRDLDELEPARVPDLLDEYADARAERVAAHLERIRRVAFRLGRQVAAHEVTRKTAAARLDALAMRCDDECPIPLLLVPYKTALAHARAAFAAGFTKAD